jgi:phosphoribulokinase
MMDKFMFSLVALVCFTSGWAFQAESPLADEEKLLELGTLMLALQPAAAARIGRPRYDFGSYVSMMAAADSKPTGLVWPSPEAEEKLKTIDGIKMYPTHAWLDDHVPILPAEASASKTPVMIGVAADSGCGKSTFLKRVMGALGTEVVPGHTAIGDMMTVICLDDYHINDRAGRKATGLTALDAAENDFALMGSQMEALAQGKAVYKPIYNHDSGFKDPPELIQPNKLMIFEGLHPIYDAKAGSTLDLAIYIDIVNEVKFAWKVKRDVEERGWTEEQVREDIQKRLPDFSAFVDPQRENADVILRYEPSDKGLPYLKVKLMQKQGGAFPIVGLKPAAGEEEESVAIEADSAAGYVVSFLGGPPELTLEGTPGATVKMYNEQFLGLPFTVLEMDGELDKGKFEAQLKEIESRLTGLNGKTATELTDAMVKLKSSPGSDNGTGVLQTIIAMKIREVYDKKSGA